jgi:hypothetical protein
MSTAELKTKKNTTVNAHQFEDAEEEDEKDKKCKKRLALVKEEPPSDLLAKGAFEDPKSPLGDGAAKESTESDDKQEDNEKKHVTLVKTESPKTETKASTPTESPITTKESGHITPVSSVDAKPMSAPSPLDALASIACVADERRQADEPPSDPVVNIAISTNEDIDVSADAVTCTDGRLLLLLLLR